MLWPMNVASQIAQRLFIERVEAQGGTVLESGWLGVRVGHLIRCGYGHESRPQPQYLARGGGICSTCGYRDRVSKPMAKVARAEAAFRARVSELGGLILESGWLGNQTPHLVECSEGHRARVRPNNVTQGSGICLACTWATQDVVYVVAGTDTVKFGITSGDPRPRLNTHRRDGLPVLLALRQGLPVGRAFQVEQLIMMTLAELDVAPVRGREYFPAEYAPTILGLLDEYLC